MADATPVPDAILAEEELAQALHDWAARWVAGHEDGDQASCFAPGLARAIVEGGQSQLPELLVRSKTPQVVLVCATCLRAWREGHTCG